ncbi:hypothetical protein PHO31112_01640 [Pandoraea horticolens]|uniref:Transmembrane protein n=1 Tax=Pandoraea horticolens TaxID=2508298 RepID=A0A5E4TXU4_9BURK|nr:hypothetical protein [Pandoraea horticolens]VVD91404.1 hypothetical protein PHO31112_01640 [Pandoraea horticolens]
MAVSFGLAKKIIDHPTYNLGLALPFVAAFYLLNDTEPVVLPLIGYVFSEQVSDVLKIIGVAFYYAVFLMFFVLAGALSHMTSISKLYFAYPIMVIVLTFVAWITDSGAPKFNLLFTILAVAYLVFSKVDEGNVSLLLVGAVGTLVSLLCFVAGVLWFEEHYIFQSVIADLFGFKGLAPESLKIGWPMLITLGYVLYFAIFQTSELWGDLTA